MKFVAEVKVFLDSGAVAILTTESTPNMYVDIAAAALGIERGYTAHGQAKRPEVISIKRVFGRGERMKP